MLTPDQLVLVAAALGLPKLLVKLLDVIQSGAGTATEAYYIRKKGEAEIDVEISRINRLTEALDSSQKRLLGIEYSDGQLKLPPTTESPLTVDERATKRLEQQQHRKQLNIESVTAAAADELSNEPELEQETSDEPLDPDWISRFFSAVEDVSDRDMQVLWGRILADEIKRPQTWSLRTLEFLRNVSKEEAEVIARVAQYACESSEKHFVLEFQREELGSKFNISFLDILLMKEIGILHDETLALEMNPEEHDDSSYIIYNDDVIIFELDTTISFHVLVFTKIGSELSRLLTREVDNEYVKALIDPVRPGTKRISQTKVLSRGANSVHYDDEAKVILYEKPETDPPKELTKED